MDKTGQTIGLVSRPLGGRRGEFGDRRKRRVQIIDLHLIDMAGWLDAPRTDNPQVPRRQVENVLDLLRFRSRQILEASVSLDRRGQEGRLGRARLGLYLKVYGTASRSIASSAGTCSPNVG